MHLERYAHIKIDFEIGDAIDKLEKLGIVTKKCDRYCALPIEKALEHVDHTWDNYFQYNTERFAKSARTTAVSRR